MFAIHDPPLQLEWAREGELIGSNLESYTSRGNRVGFNVWPTLRQFRNGPVLSKGVVQPIYWQTSTACIIRIVLLFMFNKFYEIVFEPLHTRMGYVHLDSLCLFFPLEIGFWWKCTSRKDVYNDENKFYLTNIKLVDRQTGILFLFFHKQIFSCIICIKKYIMSKFLLQNCVKVVYTVYF